MGHLCTQIVQYHPANLKRKKRNRSAPPEICRSVVVSNRFNPLSAEAEAGANLERAEAKAAEVEIFDISSDYGREEDTASAVVNPSRVSSPEGQLANAVAFFC